MKNMTFDEVKSKVLAYQGTRHFTGGHEGWALMLNNNSPLHDFYDELRSRVHQRYSSARIDCSASGNCFFISIYCGNHAEGLFTIEFKRRRGYKNSAGRSLFVLESMNINADPTINDLETLILQAEGIVSRFYQEDLKDANNFKKELAAKGLTVDEFLNLESDYRSLTMSIRDLVGGKTP